MFSSLPSASKVYASSTKSKQKFGTANVKRKRRRSKVQVQPSVQEVNGETDTLIGASRSSVTTINSEFESESVESGCIVKFCTENEVGSEEEGKEGGEDNLAIAETDATAQELVEHPTLNGDHEADNVIVTSAEIHYDTSTKVDDDKCSFNQPPVIIISSADSPPDSFDENDEESVVVPLTGVKNEFAEVVSDAITSEVKGACEAALEEVEGEVTFDLHCESVDTSVTNCSKTMCSSESVDHISTDNQLDITKMFNDLQDIPESKNLSVNKTTDNASIKSDCCLSKDIYNEYYTDTIDETDDNFMMDDSKSSSSNDESSPIDSEDIENGCSESPRTSEVSGTESSLGGSKKIPQDMKDCKGNKPFLCQPVPKQNCYFVGKSHSSNSSSQRTKSLPDVLKIVTSRSVSTFQNEKPKHANKVTSDVSVCTSIQEIPRTACTVDTSVDACDLDGLSKSCRSSSTNFSNESSTCSSVLPPVTVQEARSRSYLVGSIRAAGSLLGEEELTRYFPDKKVNIFVGTWNMNGQGPPKCINDFLLPLGISHLPDIYAIGVQEGRQPWSEWEIMMQTTIGPSHILFMSSSLGVLHLAIFIRRDLVWFCSEPEEANVTTRPGSMVKTKGAVAVSFLFFGTSFLFINSHLTAHERKLKERVCDYEKIITMIDLPKNIPFKASALNKDVTSRFDNVFWCGDLNFRVVQDRPSVLSFVEEKLRQTLHTCDFLLQHDQLHKAMSDGSAFHGFQEGNITFVPSYKFDVGTSFFNSTKQRVPSYTDRVLYRCKREGAIHCSLYNVVSNILTSDHKPVYATFEVDIRPGRDNIPLAAGQFRREVYIEANRRRAMALEITPNQKNSTVCAVM